MLNGIEDADGGIIVDGKETIGRCIECHQCRSEDLGIGTVVANTNDVIINGDTIFQQGILITIEAVLGYLQLQRSAIEGNPFTACLDEMGHSLEGSHIVVDHHTAGIDPRTDSIIEHDGNTGIDKSLIMIIVFRILGLRHNHATNFISQKILTDMSLALVLLTAECHHDTIAANGCRLLDTCQDG